VGRKSRSDVQRWEMRISSCKVSHPVKSCSAWQLPGSQQGMGIHLQPGVQLQSACTSRSPMLRTSMTMRELELSSRLVSALDSAGALDASIKDFCARFSFQVLYRRALLEESWLVA
jgi:hypothetical protein